MLCFKQTGESEGFFCHFGFPLIVGSFWCVMPVPVIFFAEAQISLLLMQYAVLYYIGVVD